MPLPDAPPTPTAPTPTAATPTPPMSYQDLYDLHQDFLKENPESKLSLHEFSDTLNKASGSQSFSQGLNENSIRDIVAAKNRFIQPVTQATSSLGDQIDQLLGTSTSIGGTGPVAGAFKGLPETIADLGVVAAPTIIDPAGGEAVSAALAPAVFGGSGAANTYGETGSVPGALVSGAAGVLLPASGKLGADLAGKTINKYLGREVVGGMLPGISPTLGRLADFVGANAGIAANQQLADVATAGAVGGLPQALEAAKHVFSVDNVIGQAAGLLPFAGHEVLQSRFGKPNNTAETGRYNSTAEMLRDQENLQHLESLQAAIKERYLNTATTSQDVQTVDKTPTPLNVDDILDRTGYYPKPTGKSAEESAMQMKLGNVNGVVGNREGDPYKSAADSAQTIASKYDLIKEVEDDPSKTLFQQPTDEVKSAKESAESMQSEWNAQKQVSESPVFVEPLKEQIKGGELNGEGKGEVQSGANLPGDQKASVEGVRGSQSDRPDGKATGQNVGGASGERRDDLGTEVFSGSDKGKGGENEPLSLTPEVVDMAHNPPTNAEEAQTMMETNNHVIEESNKLRTDNIRSKIQSTFDFENADMQPFTDEWITKHYEANSNDGLTDKENYADILAKAQATFRDNVNKVNAQLLVENDRRSQQHEESNKQTQKGKESFQRNIESLQETLASLPEDEKVQAQKDITTIAKEKGGGQQTQGEANMYEAASVWLKKPRNERSGTLRGVMAKAYDLGTREEMRAKSSETEETEVNAKGETVKVRKMPKSINAPVGDSHKEYGETLQDVNMTKLPNSDWLDKEAEKLHPNDPTAQETERALKIQRVNEAIKLLKAGGDSKVLEAFKNAALNPENKKLGIAISPRQPAVAIEKLLTLAQADMTKLTDHELVGHLLGENGKPLSEESIHGERAKGRKVLAELLKLMEGDRLSTMEDKADSKVYTDQITKDVKSGNLLEAIENLISRKKGLLKVSQGTEISLQQSAKEFFSKYASKLGLAGEEHKLFSETAQRIAASMESVDKIKLGELNANEKRPSFGVLAHWENKESWAQFIGVLKDPYTLARFMKVKSLNFVKYFSLFNFAHEISHSYETMAERSLDEPKFAEQNKAFTKIKQMADSMSREEKNAMLYDIFKLTVPRMLWKGDQTVETAMKKSAAYSSQNSEEFLATLNGLIHVGMATSPLGDTKVQDFSEYLTYSSAAMQDFARGIYLNLQKYGHALEGFWRSNATSEKAKQQGIDSSKFADIMHEALTFQRQFGRIPEEVNKRIDQLSKLKSLYPGVYLDHFQRNNIPFVFDMEKKMFVGTNDKEFRSQVVTAANSMGMTAKSPDDLFKKSSGMWSLMTAGHWAQKFPALADVIDLAHNYIAISNEYTSKAIAPLLVKFDKQGNLVRDTSASGIREIINNPKAHEALNNIFRWQNENGNKVAPDEIIKEYTNGLNPQMVKQVKQYRDAMSKAMTDIATRFVASKQADMTKAVALLLLKENPNLKYSEYMQVAQDLVNAKLSAGSSDSGTAAMANAKLQQMMATATPGMMAANRLTDALTPEFQKFSQQFLNKPGYTPETREGPYMVKWGEMQQDGTVKPFTLGFKDKKSATDRYNKLVQEGKAINLQAYDKSVRGASTEGLNQKVVEAFSRFDDAAFKAALQYAPEAAKDIQNYFQSGEGLLKEMQSRGYRKNLMQRGLAGGREELNILQECFNYIQSSSTGMARNETRGQLMLRSNEAKVLAEPNLRQEAIGHVENTINPPSREFNKLKEGIFQYYLGGNLSSIVVDMSHPFMALAPFLIEKGAGMVGAYKNLAYGCAKIGETFAKGGWSGFNKATTPEDFQKLVGDKDLAKGLALAKQDGLLTHGILNEFRVADDLDLLNLKAIATEKGGVFNNTGELLKNSAYQYLRFTRQLFSMASKNNNLMTYMAAFKTAKDQGNSVDEAHDFASKAVNTVLPQGGRGSRPVVFSKLGKAQSVVGVMYALQSYTTGLLSMHARLAADSLGQSGLSGVQLSNARKALATAVVTQVALSGVLGLPFVGATLALLQNIFPELKASQMLRETFHNLGSADQQMGDAIADSALKGLPAMLFGVDLSGRLGLGNILGTNPYSGFDATALLGPTGSLVQKMVLGAGDLVQGNVQGAAENMLPIAYKNLLDAYVFDKVGRDKDGNMLEQPDDATRFLSAVGLKTTKETNARDEQGMLKQSQRASAIELKKFYSQVADHIATGDMDGAKQLLYSRSQVDPAFSPQAGVKASVQTLLDRQAPRDMLARVGISNSEDAQRIASLFPPQTTPSHESADEVQKRMLEREVGVPGVGMTPQAKMREAQAVDYLVDSYHISPSQARAMLSHTIDARQKLGQRQAAWQSGVVPSSQ